MAISAIMNTALSGMQVNAHKLATTAHNIANAATPGYDRHVTSITSTASGAAASSRPSGDSVPHGGSNVDLGREMHSVVEAEIGFKANAAVWETGAEIWDVLLSIKRD